MSSLSNFHYEFVPGASAQTLLLLHGTGGNEHDLFELGRALDASANLLSPRGRVLENGQPRFFRRLAEGVFDLDDLKLRTHELADFVAAAARQHGFDPGQVTAAGYSNGANIAGALLLLRPETLQAAVLFRPMVPLVPAALPDLAGVHVYIAAGRHDPISPPAETERLAALLRNAGANVEISFAEAGHGLSAGEAGRAEHWLKSLD